jgi:CPA2 family monovalent cation:H+ antiporter-2
MSVALKERTSDIVLFVGIALSLIIANIISWLGFSIEIGAFVAGLVLAGTQFRYQLGSQLAPFREFFLGIFFLTVGMQLGLGTVWDEFSSILGLLFLLLLCKIIGITAACVLFKVHYSVAILTGFSLAQAGEFGLILLQQADSLALLSEKTNQIVLGTVIISLVLTPYLLKLGQTFSHLSVFSKNPQFIDQLADVQTDNEILLVGYGPAGRRVASYLTNVNINFHVIDLNINAIKQLERKNISASIGDATQSEVLIHAGLMEAKYLIIAVPDENITLRVSAIAKSLNSKIQIIARLVHESQLDAARSVQIDIPVVEETLVGNTLVESIQAMLASDKESYSN